ncbi:UDP-N-acetylmuramoyl-tripeptide--D-alanyl-D-alanine ligase [Bacillus safensis]|uniref:UDP-N-acetylmuramoyl-tripeptide--D-alanyl-D- alanine ligase n=1 Tax=Bacillus TaxID=1386 RepID=UPI000CCC8D60|nr:MULTISPECIES: UDP-N-acetylmuramoyl-tripeptide--D-alanyl-D-alanine ligase [Bacillus]PNU22223.1 UDP-N-acetylmuramoyl-tripeptide--D-alanyl-D-alanine ligase [Bacillus stratosphericus]MBI1630602.1 UDP-N-acetylmuramoyl-tripeptide--D-alanyl-D-alanine ligase [Bacillus safensis]MCP9285582.1 UDP-N-acetylmuramoyl-tripeptide--D-alanyl-D-alanine ligase [Bacillus safensis]UPI92447.1 UDP-N-acetylmuramoyl-tripeptide--D-alanyl-D-alanine ligase [Bacillus safensis]WHX75862.1 UDP-N-acetylmuramoyl-tripeptide--D
MIKRTVKQIAQMAGGTLSNQAFGEEQIHGVTTDTRKVSNGALFIPLIGEHFNGHTFASKAVELGASAVLWNQKEANPPEGVPVILVEDTLAALQQLAKSYLKEENPRVVGITGSNGKTTTKDMIHSVLQTAYRVHKTDGNFNNHIGLPLTILAMPEGTDIAVLEMGMSAKGEIEFLSDLAEPDAAVITNIGESHMQDLGSREAIADAKCEIVKGLKEDGIFYYLGDEPLLRERASSLSQRVKTFGEAEDCDIKVTHINQLAEGTEFQVEGYAQGFLIPVLGKHNVKNALAAIAIGQHFGLNERQIAQGLMQTKLTGMRLELFKTDKGITVINDAYNASPTSMKAAIDLVGDMDGFANRILVLGDMLEMGSEEETYHYELGRYIKPEFIDHVMTYGRLGAFIAEGAKKSFGAEHVFSFMDKEDLKKKLAEVAGPDDVVLVKASRGMKLEEVITAL